VIPEAPSAPRALGDGGAIAVAVAAVVGAGWHPKVPVWLGVLVLAGAVGWRRPVALVLGVGLLASALGHRAHAGLDDVPVGRHEGFVTLVSDPARSAYGSTADVRLANGQRVQLRADGGGAGALDRSLAGERLRVWGTVRAPPPGSAWMVPRHLCGTLEATRVERTPGASAPWRAANRIRRLLARGAEQLDPDVRSLYLGFVLGDDREQAPEVADDFRGAGLTHLLVVSGQNVAFVLLLARPLTERLGWAGRWAATLTVIAAFATVTRFEPSVLRASAMAAIAVTGRAIGRPSPAWRILVLAVAALVLIDPLLVHAVGFRLSVLASLALAVVATPLAARLRGPRALRDAVAASIAAQLGVAPILIPLAGGLPVASIPANVLAVPVAGLVTTIGLPAGAVAGMVGADLGRWIHVPAELAIRWVALVARVAARQPLGQLGAVHVALLVAFAVAFAVAARSVAARPVAAGRPRGLARGVAVLAAVATAAVLVQPAVALRHPPTMVPVAGGAVHRAGGATVVVAGSRPNAADVLEGLRVAGVRRIDVLIAEGDAVALVAALRHRWAVGRVLDAEADRATLVVGGLRVEVGREVVVEAQPP
jgi:competence protein ComEC